MVAQTENLLAILLGLFCASDYVRAARCVAERPLLSRPNLRFFRRCLEVGRRFKIMNPGVYAGDSLWC
jgi:hypothetical protein